MNINEREPATSQATDPQLETNIIIANLKAKGLKFDPEDSIKKFADGVVKTNRASRLREKNQSSKTVESLLNKQGLTRFVPDLDAEIPPINWLIDDVVPNNGIVFNITGASKAGKSLFALNVAMSIVTPSLDFLGHKTQTGAVVYVDLENPNDLIHRRMRNFANSFADKPTRESIKASVENLILIDGKGVETANNPTKDLMSKISKFIYSYRAISSIEIAAVIIDPVYCLIANENDPSCVREFNEAVRCFADEMKIPVIYVHHHAKSANYKGANAGSGSSLFGRVTSGGIDLTFVHESSKDLQVSYYNRYAEPVADEFIRFVHGRHVVLNDTQVAKLQSEKNNKTREKNENIERCYNILVELGTKSSDGMVARKELCKVMNKEANTITKYIAAMENRDVIEDDKGESKSKRYGIRYIVESKHS